jgi:hypothetical protein
MKIVIESTATLTTLDGVPCRIWMGLTGAGTPCEVFVHRIAVPAEEDTAAFDAELEEQLPTGRHLPPSPTTGEGGAMGIDDGVGGLCITRDGLDRMVREMVASNAGMHATRTSYGQRALDLAVATLYDEGEVDLAAAIGLLHGMRVMGRYAVEIGLTAILKAADELDAIGFRERVSRSN